MTPFQAILFDLGNTLTASASLSASFADLARFPLAAELGLNAELLPRVGDEIDQSIANLYDGNSTDQPHWIDVWQRATSRHDLNLNCSDVERLCRAHLEHFVSRCRVQPYSVPLLASLQEANIPLGLVSNVTGPVEIFETDLRDKGLASFFAVTVWSSAVGYRKPDPKIFAIALESLSLVPGRHIVMVGDSEKADILGGKRMGFTTVKVMSNRKDTGSSADYVVTGADLLEFFRSELYR